MARWREFGAIAFMKKYNGEEHVGVALGYSFFSLPGSSRGQEIFLRELINEGITEYSFDKINWRPVPIAKPI